MLIDFLLGVGVVCLLMLALSVLIIISDAYFCDYGEVKIKINGDRELNVRGGRPLLSTLKDEKIFIPSACGGRGSCGLCKVRALS